MCWLQRVLSEISTRNWYKDFKFVNRQIMCQIMCWLPSIYVVNLYDMRRNRNCRVFVLTEAIVDWKNRYTCKVGIAGKATRVQFHVTVMSLDSIDEGSMVSPPPGESSDLPVNIDDVEQREGEYRCLRVQRTYNDPIWDVAGHMIKSISKVNPSPPWWPLLTNCASRDLATTVTLTALHYWS